MLAAIYKVGNAETFSAHQTVNSEDIKRSQSLCWEAFFKMFSQSLSNHCVRIHERHINGIINGNDTYGTQRVITDITDAFNVCQKYLSGLAYLQTSNRSSNNKAIKSLQINTNMQAYLCICEYKQYKFIA